jgi:peptidoglycan/LPS O-acetylase OafA/YrhL
MVFAVLILTTNSRADFHSSPVWTQMAAHLFLVHNYNQVTFMGINGSFWSLAIEAQLYLLYPLLLVMVGKLGWRQTMVMLACCEFLIRGADGIVQTTGAGNTIYGQISWLFAASPLGYWFSWTLGARLAESYLKNEPSPFARIPFVPLLAVTLLSYFLRPAFPFLFVLSAIVTAVAVSRLLGRVRPQVQAPPFYLNVLRIVGLWSYSIYLLHQPLLNALSVFLTSVIPGPYRTGMAPFWYFVAGWLIIIPISGLCYHVFELPGIALGKWIIWKRSPDARAPGESLQKAAPPVYHLKKGFYLMAGALVIVIAGILIVTTKLDERDSRNELQLAEMLNARHKYGAALSHYSAALEHDGNCVDALNNAAWLLATAPNPRLRDGKMAVTLASRACELTDYRQPFFIGTLAAACAEAGRYHEAIANAQKARALALSQGQIQIAGRDEQLLELYQAGKAFHETADRN